MIGKILQLRNIMKEDFRKSLNLSYLRYFNESSRNIRKINKLMVANRGEIAVRVFRAATEAGIKTLAVYSEQDSKNIHRQKADESYVIGRGLNPVDAYLCIPELIRVAKEHCVDAIHPGYGFLSEQARFAQACSDNNIIFIGPTPDVLQSMGDKIFAREFAKKYNVPIVPGTEHPINSYEEVLNFVEEHECPIILKAAYGGGGRGMRVVRELNQLDEMFKVATSEALAAFGNKSMFVEKYLENPRHIEVQILGDKYGNIVHLFERDCSVQRRHQKVVEIAPSYNISSLLRQKLTKMAVELCQKAGYTNAGTVEFLVDKQENAYFMEVNARLQVEHTVTEEITGIDLVNSQIRIAEGYDLASLNLIQDKIKINGSAIQVRVTTEDVNNNFMPDTGKIEVFRSGEGMGIRLDGASAFPGAVVTPYYDSLLVKVIAKSSTHVEAARKLTRSLKEFRVRGVKTNIPFLLNVLQHKDFLSGSITTDFIPNNPELFNVRTSQNRGQKLLNFLGHIMVNGPITPLATNLEITTLTSKVPTYKSNKKGSNNFLNILREKGPEEAAKSIRQHKKLLITDTTMRDAHQSLLATRLRTFDILKISPFVSSNLANLFSLECWGGATFDVAMRFLGECPWSRLESIREAIPNIPLQMLLRGANSVGYTNYADNVVFEFCKQAKLSGMDVFRVFDALNYLPNLQVGIEAALKSGGLVEGCLCYSGDICDPTKTKYSLEYYLNLSKSIYATGAHILCIKDMAGVLKPEASALLISEIRKLYPHWPIHLHTHDTAGVGVATCLAAAKSGVDIVDACADTMSGMTSQPSIGSIVSSLSKTDLDTEIDMEAIFAYNSYWEITRTLYAPFECCATMKSGNSNVFINEIPGGQYTNLQFQAFSLGLGDRFDEIKKRYVEANKLLGDIIKVTPTSKVVGELAQFMVQNNLTAEIFIEKADTLNIPQSVVEFFQGYFGQPVGGFPEILRKKIIKNLPILNDRPGKFISNVDYKSILQKLTSKYGPTVDMKDAISYSLYPKVYEEFKEFQQKYGSVSSLPTRLYFVGPQLGEEFEVEIENGKNLNIKTLGIGPANSSGQREVFFEFNGQMRSLMIDDLKFTLKLNRRKKAEPTNNMHVGCPMPGKISSIRIKQGVLVKKNDVLFVVTSMKMDTNVCSQLDGIIDSIEVNRDDMVNAGDLIVVLKTN